MHSNSNSREYRPENPASGEKPAIPDSPAPAQQDADTAQSGGPSENGQDVAFTIVDDPKNESVYKGPGSYAATRAERAVQDVEKAFPPLRFELRFERNLTALHVQARVRSSVGNEAFLAELAKALASTGTRLAPVVGELREKPYVAPVRSGVQESADKDA